MMERFWSKVDKRGSDDCWEWRGYRQASGHGRFSLNGRAMYAHRVAWELTNGPIPADPRGSHHGMCVCHSCDNPRCVNPAHLFLGTQHDNVKDRDSKGRHRTAESLTKLRPDQVQAIRAAYPLFTQAELAACFGVGQQTISRIVLRQGWKGLADK